MEPFFFLDNYMQEDIEYDIDILSEKIDRYKQSIVFMRILLESIEENDPIIEDIHKTIDIYNKKIDKNYIEICNLNNELSEQSNQNNLQNPIPYDNINYNMNKEQIVIDKNDKIITIKIILL